MYIKMMHSLAIPSAPQAIACVCVCSRKHQKQSRTILSKRKEVVETGHLCLLQSSDIIIHSLPSSLCKFLPNLGESSGPHPGEIGQFHEGFVPSIAILRLILQGFSMFQPLKTHRLPLHGPSATSATSLGNLSL